MVLSYRRLIPSIYTLLYMYHLQPRLPLFSLNCPNGPSLSAWWFFKDIDKSESNSWPSNGQGLAHEAFCPAWICRVSMSHIWIKYATNSCNWNHLDGGTKKLLRKYVAIFYYNQCRNTRSIYSVTLLRLSTKLHNMIIGAKQVAVLSGDKLQTEPQPWTDRNLYLFLLFTVLATHNVCIEHFNTHTFTVNSCRSLP